MGQCITLGKREKLQNLANERIMIPMCGDKLIRRITVQNPTTNHSFRLPIDLDIDTPVAPRWSVAYSDNLR